jgi:hypothetical protein
MLEDVCGFTSNFLFFERCVWLIHNQLHKHWNLYLCNQSFLSFNPIKRFACTCVLNKNLEIKFLLRPNSQ